MYEFYSFVSQLASLNIMRNIHRNGDEYVAKDMQLLVMWLIQLVVVKWMCIIEFLALMKMPF